jgi:1-acyl-sn-glycerol-3-phosphate acyltransferase
MATQTSTNKLRNTVSVAPDDLPPFSFRIHRWFCRYLNHYFRRHFNAIRVVADGSPPPLDGWPLVLYANHPSWWDAVVFMHAIHHYWPDRRAYGPMDAEALEKYRFFRRIGVFGVDMHSRRGAAQFLRMARKVIRHDDAALCLTPQGRFSDARERPVELRPGLGHLLEKAQRVAVVPLAIEYTFWEERLPELLLRFGEPIHVESGNGLEHETWTAELTSRLESNMDQLAAAGQSRDAGRFESILTGNVGVGGIYDLWRRARAWVHGKRFDAAHAQERTA